MDRVTAVTLNKGELEWLQHYLARTSPPESPGEYQSLVFKVADALYRLQTVPCVVCGRTMPRSRSKDQTCGSLCHDIRKVREQDDDPPAVELQIKACPTFARRYGRRVKELGGQYTDIRGYVHCRYVTLPTDTDESRDLLDKIAQDYYRLRAVRGVGKGMHCRVRNVTHCLHACSSFYVLRSESTYEEIRERWVKSKARLRTKLEAELAERLEKDTQNNDTQNNKETK